MKINLELIKIVFTGKQLLRKMSRRMQIIIESAAAFLFSSLVRLIYENMNNINAFSKIY